MQKLVEPYENQLIGNFLVALGYHGGLHRFPHPIRANLYQQTPLDNQFGDLMAGAKHFVILEFKRSDSPQALKQETAKWNVDGYRRWIFENLEIARQAEKFHFLVAPPHEGDDLVVARSYPSFLLGDTELKNRPPIGAAALIEELYEPKRYGGNPIDVIKYLQSVSKLRKFYFKISSGGGGAAAAGVSFLGIANDGKGRLKFLVDDSLSMVAEHQRTHEPRQHQLAHKQRERGRDRDFER